MSEIAKSLPTPANQRQLINPNLPHHGVDARLVSDAPQPSRFLQVMTVPLFAAMIFAVCSLLAAGSIEFTLRTFAQEGGVSSIIFVVVPGLFAMLFALFLYQDAQ
ncbi:MAG: hypothetical protein ACOVK7_09310, partial [Burkholderiaceae bacterium]